MPMHKVDNAIDMARLRAVWGSRRFSEEKRCPEAFLRFGGNLTGAEIMLLSEA